MKSWQEEMMACQEATEACFKSEEPTSLEIEFEVVHERSLKKRSR
jgi:hypothetical protein